jgi:hypothetical protein
VRGFERLLVQRAQYFFEHTFDITHHIVVPKSEDDISAPFQILGPIRVRLNTIGVLPAIKFNHELCIGAAEIHDKAIERHLPAELPSSQPSVA